MQTKNSKWIFIDARTLVKHTVVHLIVATHINQMAHVIVKRVLLDLPKVVIVLLLQIHNVHQIYLQKRVNFHRLVRKKQFCHSLKCSLGSCGTNEVFYERLYSGHHVNGDDSCKLFKVIPKFVIDKITVKYITNYPFSYPNYFVNQPIKWGPHCECIIGYARISNGKCVPNDSAQCANLYKPSQGRWWFN